MRSNPLAASGDAPYIPLLPQWLPGNAWAIHLATAELSLQLLDYKCNRLAERQMNVPDFNLWLNRECLKLGSLKPGSFTCLRSRRRDCCRQTLQRRQSTIGHLPSIAALFRHSVALARHVYLIWCPHCSTVGADGALSGRASAPQFFSFPAVSSPLPLWQGERSRQHGAAFADRHCRNAASDPPSLSQPWRPAFRRAAAGARLPRTSPS